MTDPFDPTTEADPADDVRQMLQRQSRSITPKGTFMDIERRIDADGTTRYRNRAVAGVAAAVLLVVLVAGVAVLANRDDDGSQRVDTLDSTPETPTTDGGATSSTTTPDDSTDGPSSTTTPESPTSSMSTTTQAEVAGSTVPDTEPGATDPDPTQPSRQAISEQTPVRIDGIGPISVPMTVTQASAATGQDVVADPNSFIDESRSCGYAQIEGLPGIWFMLDGDRITRVDITGAGSPNPTEEGVGVGSTKAEVLAAYPGRVVEEPHPYAMDDNSVYLVVSDPGRPGYSMIFSIHQGEVQDYRSGLADWVAMPEGCA